MVNTKINASILASLLYLEAVLMVACVGVGQEPLGLGVWFDYPHCHGRINSCCRRIKVLRQEICLPASCA